MASITSAPVAEASRSLLRGLQAIVGRDNVLHRPVDLQTYEYDAYVERSVPRAVVYVHSTAEVSAVVRLLAREGIPFVPRGYGTNVSGGTLALDGGSGPGDGAHEQDPRDRPAQPTGGRPAGHLQSRHVRYRSLPRLLLRARPRQPEGLLPGRKHRRERERAPLLQIRGYVEPRIGTGSGPSGRRGRPDGGQEPGSSRP